MGGLGELVYALFGVLGGGGLVSALILRRLNKMDKKLDSREVCRIEESILIISGLEAVGHLAQATATAQKEGKCNGEMSTAMDFYKKWSFKLNDHLLKKSAERIHSNI